MIKLIIAILAAAALFAGFGLLLRRSERAGCGTACEPEEDCSGCEHYQSESSDARIS